MIYERALLILRSSKSALLPNGKINKPNFKEDFILTKANYLLNHSVGRPLKTSEKNFSEQLYTPWKNSLSEPWEQWLEIINEFTASLAKLFNAKQSEFCPQINLSSGLTKILMSLDRGSK